MFYSNSCCFENAYKDSIISLGIVAYLEPYSAMCLEPAWGFIFKLFAYHAYCKIFVMIFCRLPIFFFKIIFFIKIFREYHHMIRVSNKLDPDQAQCFVGTDLGPNCLQGYQQTTPVGKELINEIAAFQPTQILPIRRAARMTACNCIFRSFENGTCTL